MRCLYRHRQQQLCLLLRLLLQKYPHIIRRNRTSVQAFSAEMKRRRISANLPMMMHEYFGMGCGNITKSLCAEKEYDFVPLLNAFRKYAYFADHNKYKNNYDYQLGCAHHRQALLYDQRQHPVVREAHRCSHPSTSSTMSSIQTCSRWKLHSQQQRYPGDCRCQPSSLWRSAAAFTHRLCRWRGYTAIFAGFVTIC